MSSCIKKLLDTAYNELCYLEKGSNSDLDSKYDNAGSENYTKYARDCFAELQGMAWCAMFVWWCFQRAFDKITAKNLIGEKTAKCSIMKQRMIDIGCQRVSNAKEGDIVFFDRGSGISHVGIVYSIGDMSFSTIEGNTSQSKSVNDYNKVVPNGGGVFIRAYNFSNVQINDFIRPKWELIQSNDSQDKETTIKVGSTGSYNATVNATNVNVRAGAGTQYRVITMVSKPYKLNILDTIKDNSGRKWYKFKYNSADAYICAQYVNSEA